MALPVDYVRSTSLAESTGRVSNNGVTTESHRAINTKAATHFSTTNNYRQLQTDLLALLKNQGLEPDQATQLADMGGLELNHMLRVILISQTLQKNPALFQSFVDIVRRIILSKHNITQGLRVFLDSTERALEMNTPEMLEKMQKADQEEAQKAIEAVEQQKNQTPEQQQQQRQQDRQQQQQQKQNPEPVQELKQPTESETNLYRSLGQQMANVGISTGSQITQNLHAILERLKNEPNQGKGQLHNENVASLQALVRLAKTSITENPKKYHIDLFSFANLRDMGLRMEYYVKVTNEVSPLRLLNVLIQAQKVGHKPVNIIGNLMTAYNKGESIRVALKNLESEYGVRLDHMKSALDNHVSITAKEVKIMAGQSLVLSFLGFDVKTGVIPAESSSFVIFPTKQEYSGNHLNLSFLPPGVYMIMARAMNEGKHVLNLWIKVIVEKKVAGLSGSLNQDTGQNSGQQSPNDEQTQQDKKSENPFYQSSAPTESSSGALMNPEAVKVEVGQQPANHKGPFLGEIQLPLHFLSLSADDLVITTPPGSMIMEPDEFFYQRFLSPSMTFRFLSNYVDFPEPEHRHELMRLKASRVFAAFNDGLVKFARNPKAEKESWLKTLDIFFDSLGSLFPQGRQTFDEAHKLFQKESEDFMNGNLQDEVYQASSLERVDEKFMAAFYAKGSYAMATAGDVNGALQGMSYASLLDLSEENHQAVLGEFINDLRDKHFATESDLPQKKGKSRYDMHLSKNFDKRLLASPQYKDQGEAFIKAIKTELPQSGDSSQDSGAKPLPYGYRIYGQS